MACESFAARLAEKSLEPSDRELARHLKICPDCRAELARQQELQERIFDGLDSLVSAEAPASLLARVRRQLDAEVAPRPSPWLRWAMAGAAAAALAGFAIWFAGHALFRRPVAGPQPAQARREAPGPRPASATNASAATPASAIAVSPAPPRPREAAAQAHRDGRPALQAAQVRLAPPVKAAASAGPQFTVIVPPGQREAVLRLVAALKNGRVDVAALLTQQELGPMEIKPLKIAPLDEKQTADQTGGDHQ